MERTSDWRKSAVLVEIGSPIRLSVGRFTLHARSRGTLTVFAEEADIVFSVEAGTPFRQEEIASQYMG